MHSHLADDIAVDRVLDATAAGTSTPVNGAGVDLAGFDGVLFVALFGTLTATQVTAMHAEQSSDDGSSDTYADIADSESAALDDDDDNKMLLLDIFRPEEQYVRPVVTRGTANAAIDGIIAIRYRARDLPITQSADVIEVLKLAAPVAGTA